MNNEDSNLFSFIAKAERYCAYQERCTSEVRELLRKHNLDLNDQNKIIKKLQSSNFLSDKRYTEAIVRGKTRIKQWGRFKIRHFLKNKGISEADIQSALQEFPSEEYDQILQNVINKKNATLREKDPFKRTQKLCQFAVGRGFESDLVRSAVLELQTK